MNNHIPHVVIVGGGFGGLAAAKALGKSPAHVTLIDRNNHHVFQPLLYQVATSVLTPGQIGAPIREVLAKEMNVTVILGEVTGVDKDRRRLLVNSIDRVGVPIDYDYLVLATGVRHSYFGHDEFAQFAPGLKGLADAVAIRNKILQAFEQAEAEEDPAKHRDLLTFVLVGAGPTGVELAGAIAVLVRTTLQSEFRRIDPMSARIVLVDMAPRILGGFRSACPPRPPSGWRSWASRFASDMAWTTSHTAMEETSRTDVPHRVLQSSGRDELRLVGERCRSIRTDHRSGGAGRIFQRRGAIQGASAFWLSPIVLQPLAVTAPSLVIFVRPNRRTW